MMMMIDYYVGDNDNHGHGYDFHIIYFAALWDLRLALKLQEKERLQSKGDLRRIF